MVQISNKRLRISRNYKMEYTVPDCPDGNGLIINSLRVVSNLEALFVESVLCDVTFVVGSDEIHCHRLILSASSDVFQAMLTSNWAESGLQRVVLHESPECVAIFRDFIRYFYTGSMFINIHIALPVLILADKYIVKDLVTVILDYMEAHIARAALSNILLSWLQYAKHSNHDYLLKICENFYIWNLEYIITRCGILHLDTQFMVFLLKQNDLVVRDEMTLYRLVVSWLNTQSDSVEDEKEMRELVVAVMSHIRFPMLSKKQLGDLLLCPLTTKYKEFFIEKMSLGLAVHSGDRERLERFMSHCTSEVNMAQFVPRLYTSNTHATLLTIERVPSLPCYYRNTLVFSSNMSLTESEGDRSSEWVVEVFPKGISIEKCFLISYEGKLEVPSQSRKTVRVSITCRDPDNDSLANNPVKVGILIYAHQDNVEAVLSVTKKIHWFTRDENVLHIDDLLPFTALNCQRNGPTSQYLVGPKHDTLKMHVIIQHVTFSGIKRSFAD